MSGKMPILKIHLRSIAQATENPEKVGLAMEFASGTDEVAIEETEGHFGNPIIIFEVRLSRARDIRQLVQRLDDAGILELVMDQCQERLDNECNLYFRLDKQKAFLEELALAEDKDVIAVTMKIAAYPAKRENALAAIDQWLSAH